MLDVAGRLKDRIEALRQKLFTLEEYPFIERNRLPLGVLKTALELAPSGYEDFASRLSGREIEALLLDYRSIKAQPEQQKISQIISLRFSRRLLRLIMSLYQYDFNMPAMTVLVSVMAKEAERRGEYPDSGLFFWKFGLIREDYHGIDQYIVANEKELDRFFANFHLRDESPLAEEISYHYLRHGTRETLFLNLRYLMKTIEKRGASDIQDLVVNYLSVFPLEEYLDGINLAIYEKFGDPYAAVAWQGIAPKLKDKFAQWRFLYLLKLRSHQFPNKYKVLSQYYSQVRSSMEMEEGRIMVLDFGEIIVADLLDKPYSLFYYKLDFEKAMADWQDPDDPKEPAFIKVDKIAVSARDYIIEEMEDSCMLLSYEGVDTLYIAELLDIKMGLEPDMRANKGKKRQKKTT